MSKSLIMFFENEQQELYTIPKNIKITNLISEYNSVKRSVALAEKGFRSKLPDDELYEAKQLFKDSNVQLLMDASEKLARQKGWVCPQFFGGLTGGITQIDFGVTVETNIETMFSLVLLGAAIGGNTSSIPISELVDTLVKFKEEDAKSDYTTMVEPQTLWKTND
jgi:hypothetical protein